MRCSCDWAYLLIDESDMGVFRVCEVVRHRSAERHRAEAAASTRERIGGSRCRVQSALCVCSAELWTAPPVPTALPGERRQKALSDHPLHPGLLQETHRALGFAMSFCSSTLGD